MTRLIVIFLGVRPVALSPYATLAPSSPDMKRDTKSTGAETPAFACHFFGRSLNILRHQHFPHLLFEKEKRYIQLLRKSLGLMVKQCQKRLFTLSPSALTNFQTVQHLCCLTLVLDL